MVDYSKWDHIDVSDDSDEDEGRTFPKVTKFEKPGSIKISKEGVSFAESLPLTTKQSNINTSSSIVHNDSLLWRNGSKLEKFVWSQTQTEVTVRFNVPADLAAKNIKIKFTDTKTLHITEINSKAGSPYNFNGRFQYYIRSGDSLDSDTDEYSDWEILTIQDQRYIVITLQKVSVIAGAVFWWDRVFEGDPAIDVTTIADRRGQRPQGGQETLSSADTSHSNVWEEAHKMFREKVASQQPREVLIDNEAATSSNI